MSNKTQLQTNNTALDALITRVNAAKDVAASLPEAGESGGGGDIETCTIKIINECVSLGAGYLIYCFTCLENNAVTGKIYNGSCKQESETIIENVICNSPLYMYFGGYGFLALTYDGVTIDPSSLGSTSNVLATAPSTGGSTGIITIIDDD